MLNVALSTSISNITYQHQQSIEFSSVYPSVWKILGYLSIKQQISIKDMKKKICVTGIDTFLGSWIVYLLLQRGYSVRGIIYTRKYLPKLQETFKEYQSQLEMIETSLLTLESYELALRGCNDVIFTGMPTSCTVNDPWTELNEPELHTINSRIRSIKPIMTNFIQACVRGKIQKIIFTSSLAAMIESITPDTQLNETTWNQQSSIEKNPYFYYWKMVEESAWRLIDQVSVEKQPKLVTICPGTIIGPMLFQEKISPGSRVIFDLLTGKYSILVDLNWSIIDVRDCAQAHILALETHTTTLRRLICINKFIWLSEIVDILSQNGFSNRPLPWSVGIPDWVTRVSSYSMQLGQVGTSLFPMTLMPCYHEKLITELNLTFHSIESSIIETANDFLTRGFIKPWTEDAEILHCSCCQMIFSFYYRKHHCRECGNIVCDTCSRSRAPAEGFEEKARVCDQCVAQSLPLFLNLLSSASSTIDAQRKAIIAVEALFNNFKNHELGLRIGCLRILLQQLTSQDEVLSSHASGALYTLSKSTSGALQMICEGAILEMIEIPKIRRHYRTVLQTLRNLWSSLTKYESKSFLYSVIRTMPEDKQQRVTMELTDLGLVKSNILLSFVHMYNVEEISMFLLPEGLAQIFYLLLISDKLSLRRIAANAIKHMLPYSYKPINNFPIAPYTVDSYEDLLTKPTLSDVQFLIKGSIEPVNAHKVVLFCRNAYFKNMFGSMNGRTTTIEITNCQRDVFVVLLRFLYTGKLQLSCLLMAQQLLAASYYYQVKELQDRVELYLLRRIDHENIIDLLLLSKECGSDHLFSNCLIYLLRNLHECVALKEYIVRKHYMAIEILNELARLFGERWKIPVAEIIMATKQSVESSPLAETKSAIQSPFRRSGYSGDCEGGRESLAWMSSESDISEGIC